MNTLPLNPLADLELQQALDKCRSMIQVGSKSFSLAAKVFGPVERDAAFLLYGWCRFCDDTVDSVSQTGPELWAKLDWLRAQTLAAYGDGKLEHDVFVAFRYVVQKYQIPRHYPLELLEGMAMDLRKESYPDFGHLSLYCYRVAGTVGLMMSHIMGVSDAVALKHATDLGMAMQLTNIARDVHDDARMGRVYLPLDWLAENHVSGEDVLNGKSLDRIYQVVARLVRAAESYYQSGDRGLKYLSFRPACAVAAARCVYSEIGRQVIRDNTRAWETRVWIRPGRKLWVMARGIVKVLATMPRRWFHPWKANPIQIVWRHA